MDYRFITCEFDGPIMVVTLNKPEKLNAYDARMGAEIEDAFHMADRTDSVRVVVVTGAGRAFCAGVDISSGAAAFDPASEHTAFGRAEDGRRAGAGFVEAIFNCSKPCIAAINGPAVGIGATLMLPFDMRIASSAARIGFVFTQRGMVPEAASAWFLPNLVGIPTALRWCIEGGLVDAQEALRGGLVSEVLEPEALLPRAMEIARGIAEKTAPVAVALTRQMIWRYAGQPAPFDLLDLDERLSLELGATADVREGIGSFIEKRTPSFPGKVSTDMPADLPWT